jgi:hypothetical protein
MNICSSNHFSATGLTNSSHNLPFKFFGYKNLEDEATYRRGNESGGKLPTHYDKSVRKNVCLLRGGMSSVAGHVWRSSAVASGLLQSSS